MPTYTLRYPGDPAQLFVVVRRIGDWAVWLDGDGGGDYSIMAAQPVTRWRYADGVLHRAARDSCTSLATADPLAVLRDELGRRRPAADFPAPFAGGLIGAFSYDLGRRYQGLEPRPGAGEEMTVGEYRWCVVLDHRRRCAWLAGPAATPATARALAAPPPAASAVEIGDAVHVDLDAERYRDAFARVRRYLRAGDCYQVNLARRFRLGFRGDAFTVYRRLRRYSPAPYGAFLDYPQRAVLSLSPECFLRVEPDGAVETRPIKGTRAREADSAADRQRLAELAASPKDRAENLMIVDLLRNDLGRVCRLGSIEVPELFRVESHATVHHLVSRVRGRLAPGLHALDLLRAALPGGSITGAPKRRAMEIIDELEPTPRGIYCGAIGLIGYDGRMDTSIAIRTAVAADGYLEYRAGGGVVWDSRCADELEETHAKAAAFLRLLGGIQG